MKRLSKIKKSQQIYRLVVSYIVLSAVGLALLLSRVVASHSFRYAFLVWNLVLAFIPVILALWLVDRVRRHGWWHWQQIIIAAAWIAFLPNSFYIITDLIHLKVNYEADLLFDITLILSFIITGLVFGYTSLYIVHYEITKRVKEWQAYLLVAGLILASCFAICLGRYTRWNTWDIILQPAGLLFDVSDRFINPGVHIQTYQTTIILFMLLFSLYAAIYETTRLLRAK